MALQTAIYWNGTGWSCVALDSGVPPYVFVQRINPDGPELMATIMRSGNQGELVNAIPELFEDVSIEESQFVFNTLFANSGSLALEDIFIFEASEAGGVTLADVLEAVGTWMLAVAYAERVKRRLREKKNVESAVSLLRQLRLSRAQDASEPDYSQSWTNFTSDTFYLYNWSCSLDIALGTIISSPGNTLGPGQAQTLSWYQSMGWFAGGSTDGSVQWICPNGVVVGALINAPIQVFGIGNAPTYSVWLDGNWSGSYTSDPYTYDSSLTGYKITIWPQAGHSSMFLTITVGNADKKIRKARGKSVKAVQKVNDKKEQQVENKKE